MRLFEVKRATGCVYEGVVFTDGATVIHWVTGTCPSITSFPSFEAFESVYLVKNSEKNASFRWIL